MRSDARPVFEAVKLRSKKVKAMKAIHSTVLDEKPKHRVSKEEDGDSSVNLYLKSQLNWPKNKNKEKPKN